ncbi:PBP1A family penicillin-binding protein [Loktanella sp. IMCC34160]|uniref:transglycosylase domain-containing protein n=1 Tax=Loktanella sp. IMCC34160 TaxID=2510646 RepID=UPI00101DB712|nr:PBP1A family penicillin-binding protein [Loktanella sp. IMCC34160]RYG91197.1 PBP1A family penicillin-binding protein [Loktanella sp. IMCC34160]
MTGPNRSRPTLVAEKRYSGQPKAAASKPRRKPSGGGGGKRRPPAKRRAPRGPLGWIWAMVAWIFRVIWGVSWRIGLVVGIIIAGAVIYTATTLPPVSELVDGRARGSVTLLDRSGQVFAWRGDQFGGMIDAQTVSPHLHNAVVATEDKRFYRHFGISPRGVASAIRINMREGRGPLEGNGGSTITQQTAKLLCLGTPYDPETWESEAEYEADCRRTTLARKVREAIYAMAMEVSYSKEDILTIYLNRAYLGAGTRGFEAAAQRYFGISANEVNPSQAAILAGLLKAPTTYAPTNNLQRSWDRANVVIGLMEDQGYLTAAQARDARDNPAGLSAAAAARAGGYFADWVMDSGPEFFTRNTTEDVIIRTTLDPRIQSAAEEALIWVFENKVREGSEAQAAIVVMSADGAVRAMVGGRNTQASGAFNRATQALRQTGSLFKPFVYATALELGMSPNDIVVDEPFCMTVPGSGEWCPSNYSRDFSGAVTLTEALTRSLNIPAVKVSEQVGRDNVRTIAEGFGVQSDLAAGPSLALGVSESTLIEMTGAYAGILNGGSSVTPYGLVELRLQGDDVPLMGTGGGIGERVIREDAARQLTWMMHNVVQNGTGQRARVDGWQIAGKTGTTQAARDAWFIGFTGDYVAGVWMGYDNNTPLTGVTGSGLPAEIWHETMTRVLTGMQPVPLPMQAPPEPVRAAPVNGGGQQGRDPIVDLLNAILGGGN